MQAPAGQQGEEKMMKDCAIVLDKIQSAIKSNYRSLHHHN